MSTLRELPIDAIAANPGQPRKRFAKEPLEELAASIRSLGVVEPIVVARAPCPVPCDLHDDRRGDHWTIVAGERRWRAGKMAGLTEIPALVRGDLSDHDAFVLSMVENVLRADMDPIEEADGYQRLLDDGLTVDELATRLGKRAAAIRSALTLRQLEPGIREMVAKGHLTAWDGSRLATLSWNGQNRALDTITRGGLTGNDRDRVIGQVWREEHEMSMFSAAEVPERTRQAADLRSELEAAARAMTRATALVAGTMPDDVTIALAEAVLRAAGTIAKVTRQAKVARMLEATA